MQIRELKILILGCGSIGKRHGQVLKDLGVREFLCCDANKEAAELLSKEIGGSTYSDYHEALQQKPDAVYILTPTSLHVEQAIIALKHGCHVFMEKPLSTSLDGIEELKVAMEEANKKVMVGFCFRYHPGIREAKRRVDAGEIGKVISIRAMMGEHFPDMRPDYRETYYVKYSGAFELIHDLDLALWFAGEEPEKVHGIYGSFSQLGFESPDTVDILLGFSNKTASVHLDFFQSPRRRQFEVMGTEGTLIVDFSKWDVYKITVFTRQINAWQEETKETTRNHMFREENKEFLDAILGNGDINITVDEGLKSLKIFEELYGQYHPC